MNELIDKPLDRLVDELKERAKELNCLYDVQEILKDPDSSIDGIFNQIIKVIPPGWQYPEICRAEIRFRDKVFRSPDFQKTPWVQSSEIAVQDQAVGIINVYYTEERPDIDEGPFFREERRLINTIADQVGSYILQQRLQDVFERRKNHDSEIPTGFWMILHLLKQTNPNLLVHISRRMIIYLISSGIKEAEVLLKDFSSVNSDDDLLCLNSPFEIKSDEEALELIDQVFILAGDHLSDDEILRNIEQWIRENQSSFLVNTVSKQVCPLTEIINAIERYRQLLTQGFDLPPSRDESVRVSLIRRLLSDNDKYIKTAKRFTEIEDFEPLLTRIVFDANNNGKLGGKGAGIFLAEQILKKTSHIHEILKQVKTPKTWYMVSDAIYSFLEHNNLESISEQKYLDIGRVRQEYPYIVHAFKNSTFPPEIIKGLKMALDDFGETPLIVRSSSLLEDQIGMSFAGKYKSLFIPNQGSREARLKSLVDAIAEVYASMFGPDPIEYRAKHGLIDKHEEMGILIQEVVGKKIGPYFFPAYAGVAFSQNEFRWSSRIKKEDGLVRIVPGLGTRAVDRLSDDYPVLASPGQPGLRVNLSVDEVIRYSPRMIDVINLEKGSFESVEIRSLLKEIGKKFPNIKNLVSIISRDYIQTPTGLTIDFDHSVVTFDGLFSQTPFLKMMQAVLNELQEQFNHPVDIEFACDGTDFYLLQCRSQSYQEENAPAEIPVHIPEKDILFTAKRYITNGLVSNISHIVYVDAEQYNSLSERQDLLAVGKAISRLNQILPKRKFVLIGPGRWGSRGDIKLGVNVTYSDIHNTAALIEVAHKRGDYVPDLSFGTHFFQDLVEAAIRYIPLYPDDHGIVFNQNYFNQSENILGEILPDYQYLEDVIHVIDVQKVSSGRHMQILMNADKNKAVAMLTDQEDAVESKLKKQIPVQKTADEQHWRWRLETAQKVAAQLDPDRFGVKGFYLFGSAKNATSGPQSDIDILIHFQGSETQEQDLRLWLEGWSECLAYINQQNTGVKTDSLLDIHIITDEDIQNRNSYAVKIGGVTDGAMPLTMGTDIKGD